MVMYSVICYRTYNMSLFFMARKEFISREEEKKALGRLIKKCRGSISLRRFAAEIGIPASNLIYIEQGINAPSPDVYRRIIETGMFSKIDRRMMDQLYSSIRELPPPKICEIILNNSALCDTIELLDGKELTDKNINEIRNLFLTF